MPINLDRFEMVVKGTPKNDPLKESAEALTAAADKITKAVNDFNARKEPVPEEEPSGPDNDTEPENDKGVPGKD